MQTIVKRLATFFLVLMITIYSSSNANAQTPADIPGGSTAPGTIATSGDGPAEVPFDGGMSLIFLASSIIYFYKSKRVSVSINNI
jgi:hypothetical protein